MMIGKCWKWMAVIAAFFLLMAVFSTLSFAGGESSSGGVSWSGEVSWEQEFSGETELPDLPSQTPSLPPAPSLPGNLPLLPLPGVPSLPGNPPQLPGLPSSFPSPGDMLKDNPLELLVPPGGTNPLEGTPLMEVIDQLTKGINPPPENPLKDFVALEETDDALYLCISVDNFLNATLGLAKKLDRTPLLIYQVALFNKMLNLQGSLGVGSPLEEILQPALDALYPAILPILPQLPIYAQPGEEQDGQAPPQEGLAPPQQPPSSPPPSADMPVTGGSGEKAALPDHLPFTGGMVENVLAFLLAFAAALVVTIPLVLRMRKRI